MHTLRRTSTTNQLVITARKELERSLNLATRIVSLAEQTASCITDLGDYKKAVFLTQMAIRVTKLHGAAVTNVYIKYFLPVLCSQKQSSCVSSEVNKGTELATILLTRANALALMLQSKPIQNGIHQEPKQEPKQQQKTAVITLHFC